MTESPSGTRASTSTGSGKVGPRTILPGRREDGGDIVIAHRVDEVIIADPEFPEREAVELVDQCHQRGVTVRTMNALTTTMKKTRTNLAPRETATRAPR